MCSSEQASRAAPAKLTPARVSFSGVKLPPYELHKPPARLRFLPNQTQLATSFLAAGERFVQTFVTKWGPMAIRARESLVKHATERPLMLRSATPARLASLSLSSDQESGDSRIESVRTSRRKRFWAWARRWARGGEGTHQRDFDTR